MKYSVVVLFWLLASLRGNAQITYDGCVDFRGIPVASVVNYALNDVAAANYAPNGSPIIFYNPTRLAWMHPQTKLFFYAHECGHHVLAHALRNIPFSREQEADCWAINALVNDGLLDDDDVSTVQRDIYAAGPGDWTHLPGPMRAINLRGCLSSQRDDTESEDDQ